MSGAGSAESAENLGAAFPPLVDVATLPRRVLVVAPHPDDEVIACGGALARHAAAGAAVRVVVLSDGAAGGSDADLAQRREQESRRAAAALGVADVRFLGLQDGALGAVPELVERVRAELDLHAAELVYAPSPLELHPDHKAAGRACAAALAHGPLRRVMLYGVNTQVPATALIDITPVRGKKQAALECFASQLGGALALDKVEAADRARTLNVDLPGVAAAEGFVALESGAVLEYQRRAERLLDASSPPAGAEDARATAVISTWNKRADVAANLDALRAQTRPFEAIVVVDNASRDGTAELVAERYPEVRLIVMPHERHGACETFNIGFASATTPLVAILDDDVVLPPEWLERATRRLLQEPATTAVLSTEVIEPEMPAQVLAAIASSQDRYMGTFRGCASLARRAALEQAGGYDERLYIYGNERDLTCRLLNLGYRVLHHPEVRAFHKTPFGIKAGKRSLYYHARNAWLTQLKYAPWPELVRLPWQVLTRVLLRGRAAEERGAVMDATGTIGISRAIRETPGAAWVLARAALSVLYNVPYCLKHRRPVRREDYRPPLA
jgi:LmbE family N-acetylglucosaminyl deacetylase/GT2 family glycosyltransferase